MGVFLLQSAFLRKLFHFEKERINMKVTLKDGIVKEFEQAVSVLDIAKSISEGLARNACAGMVDGEVKDLRYIVENDAQVSICTFDDEAGKMAFRHTTSHILAQAVKKLLLLRN
jgi:threonyl-tRNA synthetase